MLTLSAADHAPKRDVADSQGLAGEQRALRRRRQRESERSQRVFSEAVGFEVRTKPVPVILTATVIPHVTIKRMPAELLVLDRTDVSRPVTHPLDGDGVSDDEVEAVNHRLSTLSRWFGTMPAR